MPSPSQIRAELAKRRALLDDCFPQQQEAIKSNARRKAILTPRRSGKTQTVIRAMVLDALNNPRRQYAYIALTKESAEGIVWKELEDINDKYDLQLHLRETALRAEFSNGAVISLFGADRPEWMKKFKGRKFGMVCIDEGGEFDIDLRDFVFRVIAPCLTDYMGQLWIVGTPGYVQDGYWWDITRPDRESADPGWTFFRWDKYDNPFIKEQWRIELNDYISTYGKRVEAEPWFRREHKGEWVIDTKDNVYEYSAGVNDCEVDWRSLPPSTRFVLGVDAGWDDSTAFVVGCYGPDIPKLYFIDCYKRPEMQFHEIAEAIDNYMLEYPGLRIIADPNSKRFMMEMTQRYRLPVENADKFSDQKPHAIEVFNSDMLAGNIQLNMPACKPYAKELVNLRKQRKKGRVVQIGKDKVITGDWKEHPSCPNDLCDAALYIHRDATQWQYQEPVRGPEYGTNEYFEGKADKIKSQMLKKLNEKKDWWE